MNRTTPADEWEALMTLMGGDTAELDGEHIVWCADGDAQVVGRAGIEPLFVWNQDERRVEWTTHRRDLHRDVRTPRHAGDACALAYAAAATFGAISVHCRRLEGASGQTAYALTSFERLSDEPGDERATKSRAFVAEQLEQLSAAVIGTFAKHGSAAARVCSRQISDRACLVAALAAHYVPDLPIASEWNALASKLDAWALRAGVPTDEALQVGAELGKEARRRA